MRRLRTLAAMLAGFGLSACLSGESASLAELATPVAAPAFAGPAPAEIDYANATAAGIYRRRSAERSATFLTDRDLGGYGLCLRSPAASGGMDHALILFTRRLDGDAISQVDDDTLVLRRPADTAPCRAGDIAYVPAGQR
ncbi:hypothetical protein [Aurantimonas manganoxydans]|uniref:hypothetical protein n=1 Tax=Aurantimonas manganoxydans TaxID=651183 RepID=UPI0002FFEF89|nr:hypothetical protein [Aurantimonas manganoxydans]